MSIEEISKLLEPNSSVERVQFSPGNAKIICVVGLSGGVGTTSVAINYAFEQSEQFHVVLSDMDRKNPDIARLLGLHRIEGRNEKITKNLYVSQGLPIEVECDKYIFDLGSNLNHPILQMADDIYLVTRTGFNTLSRLQELDLAPTLTILNFAERTKVQNRWRAQLQETFPRMEFVNIPFDLKAFESAAESRSALMEAAGNSLARKSIATLG